MPRESKKTKETPDPLQISRDAFKLELGKERFAPGALLPKLIDLQNALLSSALKPEEVFAELVDSAGKAIKKSEQFQDASATALRGLQEGYELTLNNFVKTGQINQPAKPTSTEKMSMDEPKK